MFNEVLDPRLSAIAVALSGVCAATIAASAQPSPDYGIDFITVGAPNNPAYHGPDPFAFVSGRGSVSYEYRIARDEISTIQWMNFVNVFSTQSDDLRLFGAANHWGAAPDPSYHGPGLRWVLSGNPNAAQQPVYGITWREAAMFCNWLCNDQSSDLSALQNGAYDASTFHTNPNGTFTDQRTHNPGARYWIPTLDEWIKAAHFDPNRFGPGQEGWWYYSHRSDSPPVPGLPDIGETDAGVRLPGFGQYLIPLGAYPDTLSPWGLLDVTGGAEEWTEETFEELYGFRLDRYTDGAYAGAESDSLNLDQVWALEGNGPAGGAVAGLRIVSLVPTPASLLVVTISFITRRRRD